MSGLQSELHVLAPLCRGLQDGIQQALDQQPDSEYHEFPSAVFVVGPEEPDNWYRAAKTLVASLTQPTLLWVAAAPVPRRVIDRAGSSLNADTATRVASLVESFSRTVATQIHPQPTSSNTVLIGPILPHHECPSGCALTLQPELEIPLRRHNLTRDLTSLNDAVSTVAALICQPLTFMNGAMISIDGGMSLGRHV